MTNFPQLALIWYKQWEKKRKGQGAYSPLLPKEKNTIHNRGFQSHKPLLLTPPTKKGSSQIKVQLLLKKRHNNDIQVAEKKTKGQTFNQNRE